MVECKLGEFPIYVRVAFKCYIRQGLLFGSPLWGSSLGLLFGAPLWVSSFFIFGSPFFFTDTFQFTNTLTHVIYDYDQEQGYSFTYLHLLTSTYSTLLVYATSQPTINNTLIYSLPSFQIFTLFIVRCFIFLFNLVSFIAILDMLFLLIYLY